MALTLDLSTSECLTLADAIKCADVGADQCSLDELVENAWILKGLANNKEFLKDLLNDNIRRALRGQGTLIYTPQSVALGEGRSMMFRANLWFIPTTDLNRSEFESSLYSYGTPHDHNFNFVTAGYFGSGYKTDIYEYDRESVMGLVGESVDMRFLESTSLPKGKVMVFRSGRDIHTQAAPDEFSISINMMAKDEDDLSNPQFFFDIQRKTIVSLLDNQLAGKVSLIRFAKYLGDDETLALLDEFTDESFSPFIRAAAYDAMLARTRGDERQRVQYTMKNDADPVMDRRVAAIELI